MSAFSLFLITIFLLFIVNTSSCTDYFWREYTGTIPEDAVVGGKDINDHEIYIGQAYIKNEGLIVAQINPGVKEVAAPIKGVKKVKKYIKILCGPSQNFAWKRVNSTNLHLEMIGQHPVTGGHEDGHGQIHIGRISYQGETRIGKINSFNVGNANFRFADNYDKEPLVKSYEVLIFSENISPQ